MAASRLWSPKEDDDERLELQILGRMLLVKYARKGICVQEQRGMLAIYPDLCLITPDAKRIFAASPAAGDRAPSAVSCAAFILECLNL